MYINGSDLLRHFARVRRAALAGETVVIATRDGNLVLTAQSQVGDPGRGPERDATVRSDADLDTAVRAREAVTASGAPRRFVSRAAIIDAARSAPRIDADRFRADLDALIDPCVDG